MIATVTLNPAVDEAISTDELVLGAQNRVGLDGLDPGGKGLNASRVIARLGRETLALGFVAGVTGALLRTWLDDEGVRNAFDDVGGLTRVNVMAYERANGRRTRIYLPGARVEPGDLASLVARLDALDRGTVVVFGGSVPPGLPAAVYADLIARCGSRGLRTVLDTSGPALACALEAQPYLIKPNAEELAELIGAPVETECEIVSAAREICVRGAGAVVVSMGAAGAIGVDGTGAWHARPPRIEALSTVGSGDSMVAGLAIALAEGSGLAEGLRLGTAAGAATALQTGTRLCRSDDVARLLPDVAVRRI
ncbi:MAG TPA: 1-phosphofructokinase [Candidatus Limnocylindria bacterium]